MKKLMIAAASAAMIGGAYAGSMCDDLVGEVGCLAYDLKITVKTPVSKTMKCKESSICGSDDKWCVTYATLGSKTFNGFLWACEYTCNDYGDLNDFSFALWEKATKAGLVSVNTGKAQNFTGLNMLRFGKKAEQVQMLFDIDSAAMDACGNDTAAVELQLAGFGKWDAKKGYMTSASGSVTGTRTLATKERNLNDCTDEGPRFLTICEDFESWCDYSGDETDSGLVCSGTYTMKVNKKATAGKANWTAFVPSYAICK